MAETTGLLRGQAGFVSPHDDGSGPRGKAYDWSRPAVLVYKRPADGSLELVALENLVFAAEWRAAGNTQAPVLNGRTWTNG